MVEKVLTNADVKYVFEKMEAYYKEIQADKDRGKLIPSEEAKACEISLIKGMKLIKEAAGD